MTDQRAFYFSRANAVAGHIHHIIRAPDDHKVAIFVSNRHVAR
jgi:hypothetical protein